MTRTAQRKQVNIHIQDLCEDKARAGDAGYAIAYALLELADAQQKTAIAITRLGLNDAATPMGAIEMLSLETKRIAEALNAISEKFPEE